MEIKYRKPSYSMPRNDASVDRNSIFFVILNEMKDLKRRNLPYPLNPQILCRLRMTVLQWEERTLDIGDSRQRGNDAVYF